MWKEEKLLLRSNFSSFPHYFIYIFLTSGVKLHIHLLNVVVQFIVFLPLSTLICRRMDISKCFSESLGIWDNGSRLYLYCNCRYPQALHFLELLQYEHFRKELVNAQCAKFIDDQQLLHWQHYQRKRMQLLTAQAEEAQKQKENKPSWAGSWVVPCFRVHLKDFSATLQRETAFADRQLPPFLVHVFEHFQIWGRPESTFFPFKFVKC